MNNIKKIFLTYKKQLIMSYMIASVILIMGLALRVLSDNDKLILATMDNDSNTLMFYAPSIKNMNMALSDPQSTTKERKYIKQVVGITIADIRSLHTNNPGIQNELNKLKQATYVYQQAYDEFTKSYNDQLSCDTFISDKSDSINDDWEKDTLTAQVELGDVEEHTRNWHKLYDEMK